MSEAWRGSAQSRRRRVVLYQSAQDQPAETAAERRSAEQLRRARRPVACYGAHVNRRLRGRWFSLVPVRRRAMAGYAATIIGSSLLLCLLHWVSVSWPPLATRESLARPLRLDRPDSFGAWMQAVFLAAAAGTALLIYQLRRYRADDFKGHYRVWRTVLVLLIIVGINSLCDLTSWVGAMIDELVGRRVGFSGGDWFRILLSVGGAVLALRLISEVRRSMVALPLLVVAWVCFALPMAVRWNFLSIESLPRWLMVTSAPLVASATVWVALIGYLRTLFREVRHVSDADTLAIKLQQWRRRLAAARSSTSAIAVADQPKSPRISAPAAPAKVKPPITTTRDKDPEPIPPKRRWFGFRKAQPAPSGDVASTAPDRAAAVGKGSTSVSDDKRRSLEPKRDASEVSVKPKRGLGSFFKRSPTGEPAIAVPPGTSAAPVTGSDTAKPNPQTRVEDDEEDPSGDDGSIDWSSMSKQERRRVKREMRRGGRAA